MGRKRTKPKNKTKPVSEKLAKSIEQTKSLAVWELGADCALYVQSHGERVAEYSIVTGWIGPKVK